MMKDINRVHRIFNKSQNIIVLIGRVLLSNSKKSVGDGLYRYQKEALIEFESEIKSALNKFKSKLIK